MPIERENFDLVNSVISSIPTYWMLYFLLLNWVIMRIYKIRRALFWSGSDSVSSLRCLRNWNAVCRGKTQGGLGIINIKWQNRALLSKWLWKLLSCLDSRWVRYIDIRFLEI